VIVGSIFTYLVASIAVHQTQGGGGPPPVSSAVSAAAAVVINGWQSAVSGSGLSSAQTPPVAPHDVSDFLIRSHAPPAALEAGSGRASDSIIPLDQCREKNMRTRMVMRGTAYWAVYNYIRPSKQFACNQSITYTTHTEIFYLHNLEPLLRRWQGPVSVAIFTPGSDYMAAVEAIQYYRQCHYDLATNTGSRASSTDDNQETLVSQYVTFHLYFPVDHLPSGHFMDEDLMNKYQANCDQPPPNVDQEPKPAFKSYKSDHKLLYPINVGRNIARESANTYYVFASDIELYPSPGLIPKFLAMVRSRDNKHAELTSSSWRPRVYVNTIFEMKKGLSMPESKRELLHYLDRGDAVTFHKHYCEYCHMVPKYQQWKQLPENNVTMDVSSVAKRRPPYITYNQWEPIYIGTNDDPFYDERLSWDGRADKMTQAYTMCLLDYDFMVLDNAFLIHRPGIKTRSDAKPPNARIQREQEQLIKRHLLPELQQLYGVRHGCKLA